jgi:biotin operon repressor
MIGNRNGYVEAAPNLLQKDPEYFSIAELAERWRCSRGTVYNRLRRVRADILDFAPRGKKGKKLVHATTVFGIEGKHTRRLH